MCVCFVGLASVDLFLCSLCENHCEYPQDAVQARLKWKINEAAAASSVSLGDMGQDDRGGYGAGGVGASFDHPSPSLPLSSGGREDSSVVYAVPWVPPPDPTIMTHSEAYVPPPPATSVMSHEVRGSGTHRSEALLEPRTVAPPSPRGAWEGARPPATAVFIIGEEEEEEAGHEGGYTAGPRPSAAVPTESASAPEGYGRKYIQSLEAGLQMGQEPFMGGSSHAEDSDETGHEARLV